jgi:hypothetical protein
VRDASLARSWRRTVAPAGVALARVQAHRSRNLLLLTGIAVVVAMLVVVLGGTVAARDLSLRRTVDTLPASGRMFRVDLVGLPALAEGLHADAAARRALTALAAGEPVHVVAYRDFWLGGEFVRLGGIDGSPGRIHLISGRFPQRCDDKVCEVLQLGPTGKRELREGGIHLVRVGVGELRDPAMLGPAFTRLRQQRAQATWVTSVVLLGPSAAAVERLPSLRLLFRLASWVLPLDAARVHAWQVDDLRRRESRARAILERVDPTLALTGPDAALVEAKQRGDAYAERGILIGGSVVVALFGFALVVATALRRGIAGERRRLVQRGATRWQTIVAATTEVGVVTLAGLVVGAALGAVVVAAVALANDLPVAATLEHALFTGPAALMLAVVLALAVVLVLVVADEDDWESRRSRIRPLDVVALGAAAAVVVGLGRGTVGAGPGSAGDRTFLLVLPALACLAGGVVAARVLGPLMRLAERLVRRRSVALRLGLLALARAPARTAAAGGFLVVAIGLVVFAAAYRETLAAGARDEAAFTVPLDVTLTSGPRVAGPLDAAPLDGYRRLGAGVRAYPVLRATADVVGAGTTVESPTVIGVPRGALATMRWRSDYAGPPRSALVRRVGAMGAVSLRGFTLPAGVRQVSLAVSVQGAPLSLALVTRDRRGRIERAPLGVARPGTTTLTAHLGHGRTRPHEVIALELRLTPAGAAWLLHLSHENRLLEAPSGAVWVGPLTAGARRVTGLRGWVARGRTARITERTASTVKLVYSFQDATALYLRPRQPTDGRPIPLIASPALAASAGPGGLLTLDFFDSRVTGRVVAVARRFPTIGEGEDFVVGDEGALSTALDADAPGDGSPAEIWVSVPARSRTAVDRALARPPFSRLVATSRRALVEQAQGDPLARAVARTLGATAVVALVLALVGLWAALLSDLRDERDTLFDLEAQGAGPGTLRQHLRVRAYALLGFGLAGGVLLGYVLSRVVVSLVQVTGASADPYPPLVLDPGARAVAAALALVAVASVVAVETTLRGSLRGQSPERTSWSFE